MEKSMRHLYRSLSKKNDSTSSQALCCKLSYRNRRDSRLKSGTMLLPDSGTLADRAVDQMAHPGWQAHKGLDHAHMLETRARGWPHLHCTNLVVDLAYC